MGKKVSDSQLDNHTYKVFPNDLNSNGTVFGGLVMSILDRIAFVVAERHSESTCVTVSVDALHFLAPAKMGQNLIFSAAINRAWNTSMEIGVRVEAEDVHEKKRCHVVSAYFTFVAVDEEGRPKKVPELSVETADEKRRHREAEMRRSHRIAGAKERKSLREKDE